MMQFAMLRFSIAHTVSVVFAVTLASTSPGVAGAKSTDWSKGTQVENGSAAGNFASDNPNCGHITKTIGNHIAKIRSLNAFNAKAAAAPPSTVKAALEGMFGTREPTAKMREQDRLIAAERKSATDLNNKLRELQCRTVDLEQAMGERTLAPVAVPDNPNPLPDLIRSPQY